MKHTILSAAALMLAALAAPAAVNIVDGVGVSGFKAERSGNYLSIDFAMSLDSLHVASNQAVLLAPSLVGDGDSLALGNVGIYGRRRYYYYQRNNGNAMLSGPGEQSFMAKDKPAEIVYHDVVPYRDWMDGACLRLERRDYGCCRSQLLDTTGIIGRYREVFFPTLVYAQPKAEIEKRRTLEGRAYIDFPVDKTDIYPEYRRNPAELDSIRRTIDAVRHDPDATIDTIWLKGFASPESPYKHNTELAMGRTEALRQYINRLYAFGPEVTWLTDFEPEDWAGLRRFVAQTNLEHRAEILALIDSDMEPDAKEARIKKLYPQDYRFMLQEFYPALRHTDYRVSYIVRQYNDPREILEVMHTTPRNLDQNEFYVAASTFEPGSDEFSEVFETAARVYPGDADANLNAANAAIRRDDYAAAERYLAKAGDSAEAIYARAALDVRRQRYDSAKALLRQAAAMGLGQAQTTLDELDRRLAD